MDSSYPSLFCFFLFMLICTWRDSFRFPAVTHKMNVSYLTKVALSCYWLFRIIRFLIFWLPPFNFIYSASKSLSLSFLNSSSTLQLQFLSPWLLLFSVDLWLIWRRGSAGGGEVFAAAGVEIRTGFRQTNSRRRSSGRFDFQFWFRIHRFDFDLFKLGLDYLVSFNYNERRRFRVDRSYMRDDG